MYWETFYSFAKIEWDIFKRTHYEDIQSEIKSNGKEYVLKVDEESYVQFLLEKYLLHPLELLWDSEDVSEPKKDLMPIYDERFGNYKVKALKCEIKYKFNGTAKLFKVRPGSYRPNTHEISVNQKDSEVSFHFFIHKQDEQEFKKMKSETLKSAFGCLDDANKCQANLNKELESNIRGIFEQIKNSYKTENDFFAAINVKQNPSTVAVFSAPTITKKKAVQPEILSNAQYSSEPTMSQEMYDDVIKAIYAFGKNFEKMPSLYNGKGEEALRDQFVIILETKYNGTTATGETFNRNGKTDIILKYSADGSNLFVAECKFWSGVKGFHKAIDQLLGYLTWRDSKVALMIFVKNNDMTNVVNSIVSETPKHTNFKKNKPASGESSFPFIFTLPQDANKEIQLEIMAFHYDK